jgi:hypothetical protein
MWLSTFLCVGWWGRLHSQPALLGVGVMPPGPECPDSGFSSAVLCQPAQVWQGTDAGLVHF